MITDQDLASALRVWFEMGLFRSDDTMFRFTDAFRNGSKENPEQAKDYISRVMALTDWRAKPDAS